MQNDWKKNSTKYVLAYCMNLRGVSTKENIFEEKNAE